MPAKPLIVADKVCQDFSTGEQTVHPLHDVSFSVAENSFNIIYGASGSGKSTLLNVLSGLQAPTKGTVTIEGQNMYRWSRDAGANFRGKRLGFIYQTNYWVKSLNVLDNVAMSLYFSGMSRRKAAKFALKALSMVNMEDYAKKYPILLSGGEQQRIATARALATNPSFIIADEPTGNLDSKNGDMIMDLLRNCRTDLGKTIILVTHNMEYLPMADKLVHIEDGRAEELHSGSIQKTTDVLFTDIKKRIKRYSGIKRRGK